jgi:hypothetical protein
MAGLDPAIPATAVPAVSCATLTALPSILEARRAKRPLRAVIAERLAELVAAARPRDATIVKGLRIWLAAQEAE